MLLQIWIPRASSTLSGKITQVFETCASSLFDPYSMHARQRKGCASWDHACRNTSSRNLSCQTDLVSEKITCSETGMTNFEDSIVKTKEVLEKDIE